MFNELIRRNKKEELTIEKVRTQFAEFYSERNNDMEKIKLKAWLYHSESRHKNGNPPFEYRNYTHADIKSTYLDYIRFDLIDCEDIGGKEKAIEIVERWYA